ncbi:MAG: hypothetical protein QM820_15035 [Minicystis sp.]
MNTSAGRVVGAVLLATFTAGCDPGDGAFARSEAEPVAEATQALYDGYYVANVVPREGTFYFVSPHYLLDSSEAWGPQTLLLAVDRHVQAQITFLRQPSVQIDKGKLSKSLQNTLGFSVQREVEVTASSSTVVDEGWYKRLESYPSFQMITWDLYQSSPFGNFYVASGAVYRPLGIYFRTVVLVRGKKPDEEEVAEPEIIEPGSITAIGVPALGAEATGLN